MRFVMSSLCRFETSLKRLKCANGGHSSGISQLLIDTFEKRAEHINAVIDEVGLDKGGFAGKLRSERRKQSERK
jgi:hypothetical protein